MKQAFRQRQTEEEEESVFISMTDMTVSFLFIVMILLAFFATQIVPGETVPKELLDERDEQVARLLEELQVFRSGDVALIPALQEENSRLKLRIQYLEQNLTAARAALELEEDENLVARLTDLREELHSYRSDDRSALPELRIENVHLRLLIGELEQQLAKIRNELDTVAGGDAVSKIAQLRDELNRLHELLDDEQDVNSIEQYNTLVSLRRAEILEDLRNRISTADPTIEVSISRNQDALQFKGDGLFASGASTPSRQGRIKMRLIAGILQDVIACFSFGEQSTLSEHCNEHVAIIDALQIEGHADSTGLDVTNMDLSAKRGASIYREMVSVTPSLLSFANLRGQPILSVAGYGEGRPIADETEPGGKDTNRRIDVRFIMFSPANEESIPASISDLERIRDLLVIGEIR